MKRLLVLTLIAFGLLAAQTASSAGDAQGPPCSNITNGDGGYSTEGMLDFTVFLQKPACSFVTYSFFVTDTYGTAITPVAPPTQDTECTPVPADAGCIHYVYDLGASAPSTICISATTDIHGHLADRAPDVSDPSCPPSSPSLSWAKLIGGASGGFN